VEALLGVFCFVCMLGNKENNRKDERTLCAHPLSIRGYDVAARSSGLPCSMIHGDDKTDMAIFGVVMRAIKNSKIIS